MRMWGIRLCAVLSAWAVVACAAPPEGGISFQKDCPAPKAKDTTAAARSTGSAELLSREDTPPKFFAAGTGRPAPREDEPLVTDRPDFTEASSTVGAGRIQLESGYTFVRDEDGGTETRSHSYPEALLRAGVFADWLELRIGQNFGNARSASIDGSVNASGPEDLYVGSKLSLADQTGVSPEVALILQATLPTGHGDASAGRVLPGINLLYGWDVVDGLLTLGGSSQANGAVDDGDEGYAEFAQSLTVGYTLSERVGAYTEWFAFSPSGASAPGVGPEHYANGGLTLRVTDDLQLDVRAGVGLNGRADDLFAGSGFAIRY